MNKQHPLVSVVIIVKNNEQTLPAAIESALSQSYTNIELIVIDDGSSDGTTEIIKQYEKRDERINGIYLRQNIGRAGARNKGIDYAKGHYLLFLDSDDTLPPLSIEIQFEVAEKHDADIVLGKTKCYKIDTQEPIKEHYTDKIIDRELHGISLNDHMALVNNHQIVGRLFRMEFILRNQLRFSKERKNGEDLLFFFYSIMHARNVSLIPQHEIYYYNIGNYIGTATLSKLEDARDNLLETIRFAERHGSDRLIAIMKTKALDFASNLMRADAVLKSDEQAFLCYLSSLRPMLSNIDEDLIIQVSGWRRDIARFICSGYARGALSRWKNRSLYWSWENAE